MVSRTTTTMSPETDWYRNKTLTEQYSFRFDVLKLVLELNEYSNNWDALGRQLGVDTSVNCQMDHKHAGQYNLIDILSEWSSNQGFDLKQLIQALRCIGLNKAANKLVIQHNRDSTYYDFTCTSVLKGAFYEDGSYNKRFILDKIQEQKRQLQTEVEDDSRPWFSCKRCTLV
ncbi:hypothetical protein D5018_15695 [Parashewanella curva]|uniref:Death domain-containing protein n=1 Tax=Parashewanella curva TaxID=2338552 RepID=A0A3L8PTM0_9GAMM|nr:death domain-containing protein [Parashewanella curva]RLV58741.1 hypothetical protein D5018_15695 [Parashewanella curva]